MPGEMFAMLAFSAVVLFHNTHTSVTKVQPLKLTTVTTTMAPTTTSVIPMVDDEDIGWSLDDQGNTEDVVLSSGYPFEKYDVVTSDGYILEVHRIPHGKGQEGFRRRVPFVLTHGLFQDSTTFVRTGAKSPAFMLADAGCDVWMLNLRGNNYSCRHQTLDPDTDYEFWDFCFDEMGNYDLPASIDFILSLTGERQLYLLGFSLGGAAATVFLSDNPSYNENVIALYLLAPAISLPLESHELIYHFRFFENILLNILDNVEPFPYSDKLRITSAAACMGPLNDICKVAIAYIMSNDTTYYPSNMPVYAQLTDLLSKVTIKLVTHFLQMVISDNFAKYNYDKKNAAVYNQTKPPEYDIESVTTQVSIFCGLRDQFVNCSDMLAISMRFKSLVKMTSVPLQNHADFTLGRHRAKEFVYDVIIQEISTVILMYIDGDNQGQVQVAAARPTAKLLHHVAAVVVTHSRNIYNRSRDVFFVVPIAFLTVFLVILMILYVRSRILWKTVDEQASLVSFAPRPTTYQGNN